MTLGVREYHDLVNLLSLHPEWQEELRRLLLRDDFLALPRIVSALAEAQQRTEQSVKELAEAQQRTDQSVKELAEAQQRTDQSVKELAEAQQRTDQSVKELAEAQQRTEQKVDRLGVAVGQLNTAFGSTVEEEAASVGGVIFRQKGYRILGESFSLPLNGEGEVDVVMALQDADGKPLWALMEAKARLSQRDVRRWAQRLRSAGWQKRLAKQGIVGPYLPYHYAIRLDLGARQALEEEGIGLLKSDGEAMPPREFIIPSN